VGNECGAEAYASTLLAAQVAACRLDAGPASVVALAGGALRVVARPEAFSRGGELVAVGSGASGNARSSFEQLGVSIKDIYWTLGGHDLVFVAEAPDDETFAAALRAAKATSGR
jgi:hypothetical protein